MTTVQAIIQHLEYLPNSMQREVLDFVEYLEFRRQVPSVRKEDATWSDFSLSSAMRGMEEEETPYTLADLKESLS